MSQPNPYMIVDEVIIGIPNVEIMMLSNTRLGLREYVIKKITREIHNANIKTWREVLRTDME